MIHPPGVVQDAIRIESCTTMNSFPAEQRIYYLMDGTIRTFNRRNASEPWTEQHAPAKGHPVNRGNVILAYIGREVAQISGFVAAGIQLAGSLLLGFTIEQQGLLNAAIVLILGVLTALAVSGEKAAPLIAGAVQAVLACSLSFGLLLSAPLQGAIMSLISAGVAFWLRTQVTAPVGPDAVSRGGRHVLS